MIEISDIYERLTDLLRDVFDDDTLEATPSLTADSVDGWDSFANLRLILSIERTFQIEFAAAQLTSLQNVGELADLIATKLR